MIASTVYEWDTFDLQKLTSHYDVVKLKLKRLKIRMMLRNIMILASVLLLSACTTSSTVIIGKVSEAIDFNEVVVFYDKSPQCEFEVIAHIKIPGEYYNRDSLVNAFRQQAAKIGASAVQILYIQQQGITEFFGSARAIRCNNQQ